MIDKMMNKTLKQQLSDLIRQQIEEGVYQVGDMLPREVDYQKIYDISRITVRSALAVLEAEERIERTKGKGTIVKAQKVSEPLLKIEGFVDEMAQKGIIPTTKDAYIELVRADKACSEALEIAEGTTVHQLTRIRCINKVPVALFRTYIIPDIPMSLENSDYESSLYAYLKKSHNVVIQKIKQSISASHADENMAYILRCGKNEPILELKRVGYTCSSKHPVEYTVAKYVGSRYEYHFELERC